MALASRQTPLLFIDDFHVTGILRERFDYILYDYKMHIFLWNQCHKNRGRDEIKKEIFHFYLDTAIVKKKPFLY